MSNNCKLPEMCLLTESCVPCEICPNAKEKADDRLALTILQGCGLHGGYYDTIEKAAEGVRDIIQSLRADLHDPPHDIQCAVLRKLGVEGFTKEGVVPTHQLIPLPNASATCSGFFIANRYDRPSEEQIAERRPNGYLYYVHPKIRDDQRYWAMNPDDPTPLEDFGIRILIEGGKLHGKLVDPSRATYLDGRIRRWQGGDEFCFDYPNTLFDQPRQD